MNTYHLSAPLHPLLLVCLFLNIFFVVVAFFMMMHCCSSAPSIYFKLAIKIYSDVLIIELETFLETIVVLIRADHTSDGT